MEDNKSIVYADKIQIENISNTLRSITNWRESMNDELSCLLYIKNILLLSDNTRGNIDELSKEKLIRIIERLESLCNKEIEFLSQSILTLQSIKNPDKMHASITNPSVIKNIESARNNYNKIISNIDKLIKSSILLLQLKQEYINIHNPYVNKPPNTQEEIVNPNTKYISSSIQRENLKSKAILINEVNKELDHLNTVNCSSSISLPCTEFKVNSNNDTLNNIKKELNGKSIVNKDNINNHLQSSPSPEEIINQFALSLKLTNYKPKNALKSNLKDFLQKHKQIAHSNSHDIINKTNPSELKDNMAVIKKLKIRIEELNDKIKESCIMQNEKANYEKIKQENVQLNNEIDYLNDRIVDISSQYKTLINRMTQLEEDQYQLKIHNKKLIEYIQAKSSINNNTTKSNDIFTSLGMQSIASIDMMNNINKNIERKTHYIL